MFNFMDPSILTRWRIGLANNNWKEYEKSLRVQTFFLLLYFWLFIGITLVVNIGSSQKVLHLKELRIVIWITT